MARPAVQRSNRKQGYCKRHWSASRHCSNALTIDAMLMAYGLWLMAGQWPMANEMV